MRRQGRPAHEILSFARYLNKIFDFRATVDALTDSRVAPEFSPAAVFLAVFHGFVFRLPSFQQLEAELAQPSLQRWIGVDRAFRDDVLRYSLSGFSLEPLEAMLAQVNRTLKRNKVFKAGQVQGHIVAALDGIEVLSSYSRCCDCCLERRAVVRKNGIRTEQLQYYHRAVGCQIISSPAKPFLAFEWLRPNEGEETAALRLLGRLPDLYGSRFFDILLLDALYAQTRGDGSDPADWLGCRDQLETEPARFVSLRRAPVWTTAGGCFSNRMPPPECRRGKTYQVQIWDTEGLPFSGEDPRLARVDGSWRTTAGMISLSTGPSNTAFCTPADTVLKPPRKTAGVSRSLTAGSPPSPSFSYWRSRCALPSCIATLN